MPHSELNRLDLSTINAVQQLIVAALRNQCCLWEQESTDAAADGRLSNALMLEHWAFAADLLASTIGTEFASLFNQALNAQMNWSSGTRSVSDQMLDALTIEVASAQPDPLVRC